ncbi:SHOCT domain-containing protein [Morganella morganii]|nr:SHOCT domain-containing protein [Morganella morganii]
MIKSDSGNSYSVAEELLKWSELKEKGIISEEEFTVMKKIL